MPSIRDIRRSIVSTKKTAQITKAMQMVAASKMRRAQLRVLAARPYAEKLDELLANLASQSGGDVPPIFRQRPVRNIAVILISPDRPLAGAMPGNVNRKAADFLLQQNLPSRIIVVGRRGRDFVLRNSLNLVAEFTGLPNSPALQDTLAVGRVALDLFVEGKVDRVYLVYTQFISTLRQQAVARQILPIVPSEQVRESREQYMYEPDPSALYAELAPRYLDSSIFQAVLESRASEESARMIAMQNATDNALELIGAYTLSYNKARQAAITTQILEVAAGSASSE